MIKQHLITGLTGIGGLAILAAMPTFVRAAPPSAARDAGRLVADAGAAKDTKDKDDEKEQKVDLKDLPAAVVDGVKKAMPAGKITDAEKETKDGKTVYELDVKDGDTVYEVKVSEDGKILSKEVDKEDTKEAKGGKDEKGGKVEK